MRISQRQARQLRKRVDELERIERERRSRWSSDYVGGVNFWTLGMTAETKAAVGTARALGHYIVAVPVEGNLRLFAVPVSK